MEFSLVYIESSYLPCSAECRLGNLVLSFFVHLPDGRNSGSVFINFIVDSTIKLSGMSKLEFNILVSVHVI